MLTKCVDKMRTHLCDNEATDSIGGTSACLTLEWGFFPGKVGGHVGLSSLHTLHERLARTIHMQPYMTV